MRIDPVETPPVGEWAEETAEGCVFVLDDDNPGRAASGVCGAPRQPGSAYCPQHHARCHLADGTVAARLWQCESDALAAAVGGKRGEVARQPSPHSLRRLERAARAASRLNRSRFIPQRSCDANTPKR
jgi:hypothetical protein